MSLPCLGNFVNASGGIFSLDNDDAGRRVVDMLRELKGEAVHDMMEAHPLCKDLNDVSKGKKKMP